MAVGDVTTDTLFDAELSTVDDEITSGPSTGHKWVFNVTLANKTAQAVQVRLYRRIDSTDRYFLFDTVVDPNKTIIFGPIVLKVGHSLRGQASVDSAIDVMADGYDEEV